MPTRDLITALERLTTAAEHRDYTMGDPIRLLVVKEELWQAAKAARATLAAHRAEPEEGSHGQR